MSKTNLIGSQFGVCPICHKSDESLNIRRDLYIVCHKHKVFWWGAYGRATCIRPKDPDWEKNNTEPVYIECDNKVWWEDRHLGYLGMGELEEQEDWEKNKALLDNYKMVIGAHLPPSLKERLKKRLAEPLARCLRSLANRLG